MLVLEKSLRILDEFNPINFIIYEVIPYPTIIGFVANGSKFRIIAAWICTNSDMKNCNMQKLCQTDIQFVHHHVISN